VPGHPETPSPSAGDSAGSPFITRWDLDKTYLRTDFDTLPDLVRTALERPDQKRSVPGASALLRALGESGARIHILSGSPRQLRPRLEEKLRIDRVRWDELTLKPNLSNMIRLRFRALRDQLGYKLPVLLEARVRDQGHGQTEPPPEILVGDDAEADAFVYSLYADVCAGEVTRPTLERVLKAGNVYQDMREACLFAQSQLRRSAVTRILIHLDRQSPPSHFDAYGARVVPFYNYLEAAFVLAEDERLPGRAVLDVASVLALRHRFDGEALGRSYLDLWKRGHARGSILPALRAGLASRNGGLASDQSTEGALTEMVELIEGYLRNPPAARRIEAASPNYEELAERHKGGKNRKQFHGFAG
jgi:hypothetical protein